MNRVVGIVAAVALVMHFTLGCCAHSCQFAETIRPQFVQATEAVNTGCCHRGHRHHRSDVQHSATDAGAHGIKIAHLPCQHQCEPCSCTVTLNEKVQLPTESQVSAIVVADDQARFGVIATDHATGQVSLVLPGQHLHALCERFLI
ncbi:MAG: hypothetical protein JNM18_17335 [Planctomycetaceae bacterium]|nr:hypothetical protein [Planctomycetaceae bacterium]